VTLNLAKTSVVKSWPSVPHGANLFNWYDMCVLTCTVKPLMFACPLFIEFRELNKTVKLKGVNINNIPTVIGITRVLELCGLNSLNKRRQNNFACKVTNFYGIKINGFYGMLCCSWSIMLWYLASVYISVSLRSTWRTRLKIAKKQISTANVTTKSDLSNGSCRCIFDTRNATDSISPALFASSAALCSALLL